MNTQRTGGCACGKIRYRLGADPVLSVICYCSECRRSTGAVASQIIAVPRPAYALTAGEPAFREYSPDGGGRARHYFCRDCGSAIGGDTSNFPDLMTVRLGSLDEPYAFEPQMQVFVDEAPAWMTLPEPGQRFARGPGGAPSGKK